MAQPIQGQQLAFAWDQAAGLPQVLAMSDGARFLYGLERLGVIESGGWAYELHDALGSVRQWTNGNAAVLAMQAYGPCGERLTGLGPALTAWGYAGEWQDPTGLVYLRARWYNGALGRFTQVDPLGRGNRAYVYGSGNPLAYVDPTGLLPEDARPSNYYAFRAYMVHVGLPWFHAMYESNHWGELYGIDLDTAAAAYVAREAAALGGTNVDRAIAIASRVVALLDSRLNLNACGGNAGQRLWDPSRAAWVWGPVLQNIMEKDLFTEGLAAYAGYRLFRMAGVGVSIAQQSAAEYYGGGPSRGVDASTVTIPGHKSVQVTRRGWTLESIRAIVRSPALTRNTRVVQVSDIANPAWWDPMIGLIRPVR